MASEQFSLCWDNFHKNMSSGMNSLLENEDLVDVTLAVQGKCLKAHKMVLSVCSPYFKELFKSNPCQHPIVFMKDVSYEALSDLLQFMYQGEVQVSQENLTTFIKTAEALQIKGLTGDGNGTTEPEHETPQEQPVHHVEGYKPVPRPKKMAPAPIPTSPQVKRQRLSVSSSESQPLPPSITKTEPAPTPSTGTSEAPVQFKMEPYDQSHNLVDETGDDNFGDDTLDDNTVDDSEDYSMMEGGVGEEEPQAGTSTDGAGEGQGNMGKMSRKIDKVVSLLSQFKTDIQDIKKQLRKVQQPVEIVDTVTQIPIKFPMTNLYALEDLEKYVQSDEGKQMFIKLIMSIGGNDAKDFTLRIFKYIFTNSVAELCSWTGRKGNFQIGNLEFVKIIFGLINQKCQATSKDFENTVMEWLRHAKQRKEREMKNNHLYK